MEYLCTSHNEEAFFESEAIVPTLCTNEQEHQYARFRWENKENDRFYEALIDRDLFGWELIRIWGRKGTPRGRVTREPIESFSKGFESVRDIHKKRKSRGYNLLERNDSCVVCTKTEKKSRA